MLEIVCKTTPSKSASTDCSKHSRTLVENNRMQKQSALACCRCVLYIRLLNDTNNMKTNMIFAVLSMKGSELFPACLLVQGFIC